MNTRNLSHHSFPIDAQSSTVKSSRLAIAGVSGSSNKLGRNFDVPVCSLGIGTRVMGCIDQRLPDILTNPGHRDGKACAQEKTLFSMTEFQLGINTRIGRKFDLACKRSLTQRANETGGPACCKKLFRVGSFARSTRRGKFDIEPTVIAASRAFTPSDRVCSACMENFFDP